MAKKNIYNPEGENVSVAIEKLEEKFSKLKAENQKLRAKLKVSEALQKQTKQYVSELAEVAKKNGGSAKREVSSIKPSGRVKNHPYYGEIINFLSANFRPAKTRFIPREIVLQGRAWTLERIRQVIAKNIAANLVDDTFLTNRMLSQMVRDSGLGIMRKFESGYHMEKKVFLFYTIVRVQNDNQYSDL